jgi:hypothetical protein
MTTTSIPILNNTPAAADSAAAILLLASIPGLNAGTVGSTQNGLEFLPYISAIQPFCGNKMEILPFINLNLARIAVRPEIYWRNSRSWGNKDHSAKIDGRNSRSGGSKDHSAKVDGGNSRTPGSKDHSAK